MKYVFCMLASSLFLLTSYRAMSQSDKRPLLIRNAVLLSPGRDPLPNARVLLEGETITRVGSGPMDLPKGTEIVDAKGLFLIPGLIDSHVHLGSVPGMIAPQKERNQDLVTAYQRQLPRSYLYFGFTTLVDLNVVSRASVTQFNNQPLHPDLYDCDCALAIADGYPMHYIPAPMRYHAYANFIIDPEKPDTLPGFIKREAHSPRAAVRRVKQAGGICIKTHYEPGFDGGQVLPLPGKEVMKEVMQEAHEQGLVVVMHANSLAAHQFAAEVGVDVVVHGLWRWGGLDQSEGLPAEIGQVLQSHRDKETGFMPTVQVIAGLVALFDPAFLEDPMLVEVLPAALLDWYRGEAGQWFADATRKQYPGQSDARIAAIYNKIKDQGLRAAREMVKANGKVLFGSDTPSSPTYGNPPGYNGYLEILQLAGMGMPLPRLLAALTIENARAFGLDDVVGTVSVGKRANLLLLRRNPLETAEAYGDIAAVFIRGRHLDRQTLSARALP